MATTRKSRTRRAPLNRDRVLRTAVALADEEGLESLSMRRLAKELGVEAMSLYNHVENKEDLLAGILDSVLREVELPNDTTDWKAAIRRYAVSKHDVFRRHPWAPNLQLPPSAASVLEIQGEQMEWRLRCLREGGFSADLTYHALHVLDAHVMGFTVWEQSHSFAPGELADLAAQFLARIPRDRYPYVYEHVEQHMTGFAKGVSAFELVLDLLLDGLERMRDPA
jgi:AcrR family transcriptional regulator